MTLLSDPFLSPGHARELFQDLAPALLPEMLLELQRENSRLQRLVSELLLKNQQLRRAIPLSQV